MKEHKTQILAALALALALGMVMPGAVFASEGTAEEVEAGAEALTAGGEGANAEGDGTGKADGERETLGLQESVVDLYNRIQRDLSFDGYRKSEALVAATEDINASKLFETAEAWAGGIDYYIGGVSFKAWNYLTSATRQTIGDKLAYEAISDFRADALYTSDSGFKAAVDALENSYTTLRANEIAQIKAVMPTIEGVDAMDLKAMVTMVERSNNFGKYVALYDALQFLTPALVEVEGVKAVSADSLAVLFDDDTLLVNYSKMATAAVAIDQGVVSGLYQLPYTGPDDEKKDDVKAPATGIVNLIESGALDLGTITLVVSVALASVAGLGLIAKLYLKHKF